MCIDSDYKRALSNSAGEAWELDHRRNFVIYLFIGAEFSVCQHISHILSDDLIKMNCFAQEIIVICIIVPRFTYFLTLSTSVGIPVWRCSFNSV